MSIQIEIYSEKSFIVTGETKPVKDKLKELGGKWNAYLKDNKCGWVFSNNMKEKVDEFLINYNSGNYTPIPTTQTLSKSDNNTELIKSLHEKIDKMSLEINELKSLIKNMNRKEVVTKEVVNSDNESEEEVKPVRRLLSRK